MMDSFLFELWDTKKAYEDLWNTVKFLQTLSHGQAAIGRGFSVSKKVLSSNHKELRITAIQLVHNAQSTKQMKVQDFIITEGLVTHLIMQVTSKDLPYAKEQRSSGN